MARREAGGGGGVNTVMASALAPMTRNCPRCGALRGNYCTSRSGHTTALHTARTDLVAHLSDEERVAAYLEMRDEQAAKRAKVVALIGGAQ